MITLLEKLANLLLLSFYLNDNTVFPFKILKGIFHLKEIWHFSWSYRSVQVLNKGIFECRFNLSLDFHYIQSLSHLVFVHFYSNLIEVITFKTFDSPLPNHNWLKDRSQGLIMRRKRKIAFAKAIVFQKNAVVVINTIKLSSGGQLMEHIHRCALFRDYLYKSKGISLFIISLPIMRLLITICISLWLLLMVKMSHTRTI